VAGAAKPSGSNAFTMVFRTRYLLLMALMLMLVNWVNSTGEYILGGIVKETANLIAQGQNNGLTEGQLIGGLYSKYFTLVNIFGLLLQLFVVSRVVRHLGVWWAIMILPIISLGTSNILVFLPPLWFVLPGKVVENSTDYSLNNTVRNMLFLPCTYEQKFSAKQAIDSFFVRMGDVLSALLVFLGTSVWVLQPRGFAAINALLVVISLGLGQVWQVGVMLDGKVVIPRSAAVAVQAVRVEQSGTIKGSDKITAYVEAKGAGEGKRSARKIERGGHDQP
jgi:AAA family ATP:ADP antiporter